MGQTPITIITGHLGSGKTTLIQRILKSFPDTNFLVIENEFGEIGIDGEILAQDQNALVELNSGCVCCNIQSDLDRLLEKFINEEKKFDHIIIEATGVANPAKIVRQFVPPMYLSKHFNLSSVVCVLDALHYEQHKSLPEFELQVLTSDSFYLSKEESHWEKKAEQVCADFSMDVSKFVNGRDIQDWFPERTFFALDVKSPRSSGHGHVHYQKMALEIKGEFDPFTLENYLNILFIQNMGRIYRSKGVLFFRKNPTPFIFQGVFDSMSFNEMKSGDNDGVNRIVLIGKDLDEEKIEAGFRECLAEDDE